MSLYREDKWMRKEDDCLTIEVDLDLEHDALIGSLWRQVGCPYPVAYNFDALSDILVELYWLKERWLLIRHKGGRKHLDITDLYLRTIAHAAEAWEGDMEHGIRLSLDPWQKERLLLVSREWVSSLARSYIQKNSLLRADAEHDTEGNFTRLAVTFTDETAQAPFNEPLTITVTPQVEERLLFCNINRYYSHINNKCVVRVIDVGRVLSCVFTSTLMSLEYESGGVKQRLSCSNQGGTLAVQLNGTTPSLDSRNRLMTVSLDPRYRDHFDRGSSHGIQVDMMCGADCSPEKMVMTGTCGDFGRLIGDLIDGQSDKTRTMRKMSRI